MAPCTSSHHDGRRHSDATVGASVERYVTFNDADTNYLQAGVSGRRLGQKTHAGLKLHGAELDGVIGLTESPLRRLWPSEKLNLPTEYPSTCPTSRKAVDSGLLYHAGDQGVGFCVVEHANAYEYQLVEKETLDGVADSAWTFGPKTVLFVRVDFSDKPGDPVALGSAQSLIDTTTNNFYVAASYGQTSMTATVTPTFRMPSPSTAYVTDPGYITLMNDAINIARDAGYENADYTHNIIGSAGIFGGWAGRGYVGAKGVWVNGDYSLRVVGHELGHNYGVYHANFWNAGPSIIGAGTNVEYGDPHDMMSSGGNSSTHFNVWFKRLFDWVPSSEVQVVTASGTYRVYALETAISSGAHGLKVPRPFDPQTRDYWLEFRQAFTSNPTAMNGAVVHFGYPYSGSNGSHLLDMTPSDGDRSKSALVIGRTFSDTLAGLHFTPVGKGGTTPESLDIVVNVGTFPGNRPPTASINASSTAVANGTSVTFNVTASDPDGDVLAYAWDFDDGTFGPNTASVMKTLSGDRVFHVRCTVSDMKGQVVTVGVSVTAGTPANFTLEGTVTDSASGLGVEGVRINDGTRATFTLSNGTWKLTNVPAGSFTLGATKYDDTFTTGFTNPLTVAGSMTGLDFVATVKPGYTIGGNVSAVGVGVAGVTVSDGTRSTTTNDAGTYSLSPEPNGRYTLSATKPGWVFSFSGTNPTVEVNGANVTASFYATGQYVAASVPTALVPTAPVLSDGLRSSTCLRQSGTTWSCSLNGVPNGSWNLTATSPGVTLTPSNFTNPILVAGAARTGLTFDVATGTTYRVSGQVTTGGTPLPGVTVSDGTHSSQTDELGQYVLVGLDAGTYTLTPTRSGQTFIPVSKDVTITSADVAGVDFTTTVVNAPPTVATAAAATPNPVTTGKTATLSVLGADDNGEAGLTYTWLQQGGYPATLGANGTNAAKTSVVTFAAAARTPSNAPFKTRAGSRCARR